MWPGKSSRLMKNSYCLILYQIYKVERKNRVNIVIDYINESQQITSSIFQQRIKKSFQYLRSFFTRNSVKHR